VIARLYRSLPGPGPVRVGIAVVLLVAALVALHFFYEWLGNTFLDTGGTVG
jgi:hypothetical protein